MTKSRQDFHRNAEEFAQKFCRRAVKILEKIREKKSTRFQPAARQILVEEGQNSIH